MGKAICLVLHSDALGGGIQARRAMLVSKWQSLGFDVTIVCLKHDSRPNKSVAFDGEVIYLGLPNLRNAFTALFAIWPLINYFRRRRFDAILVGETFTIATTRLALKLTRNNSPLYVSLHNPLFEGLERFSAGVSKIIGGCQMRLVRWALHPASGIIAISTGVLESYGKEIPSVLMKSKVIYNPVIDEQSIKMLSVGNCPHSVSDKQRIVAIGRLCYQKGFDLLIKAVAKCKTDFDVYIYGDGPLRNDLARMIKEHKLTGRVFLVGLTSNPIGAIQNCDLFVLPSRWEGLGNVLIEALFCSKTIVAFDCPGGVREVLCDGVYGTLIQCEDIDGMANAIDAARCNSNQNTRWKDFEAENVAREYLSFMKLTG